MILACRCIKKLAPNKKIGLIVANENLRNQYTRMLHEVFPDYSEHVEVYIVKFLTTKIASSLDYAFVDELDF